MPEHYEEKIEGTPPKPGKGVDCKRLKIALDESRKLLQPFREKRMEFLREFVGHNYSDNGTGYRVPMNMIELAVNIFTRQLAARTPRVMVTATSRELKRPAMLLELALNVLSDRIKLGDTLRAAVMDAIFGIGCVQIGMETDAEIEIEGEVHPVGQPFCDLVDLDDLVFDMGAKRWDKVSYIGTRSRVPLEWVKESGMYDAEAVKKLKPSRRVTTDDLGVEMAGELSEGNSVDREDYVDYVEIWNVYLPLTNKLVTLPGGDAGEILAVDKPLREVEWEGPAGGPFRILGFQTVPGNLFPQQPASTWADLHHLINSLYRKCARQATRQKTILGVTGGAKDDAQRIVDAADGETVRIDIPNGLQEYHFGGVDPRTLGFTIQAKNDLSWLSGNLDALGGLSPQSETLGQDQLLIQNASRRIADMQDRVVEFARSIFNDLGWYLWYDPLIELPLSYRVPNTNVDVQVRFTPEARRGDFMDYNLEILPHSMQHQTPASKLQAIQTLVTQVILPAMPLFAQMGMSFNMREYLSIVARYGDLPEVVDLIAEMEHPQGTVNTPGEDVAMMPKSTTRRYERVNRPAGTRMGRDAAMTQTLLGAGVQDSEMAALSNMRT